MAKKTRGMALVDDVKTYNASIDWMKNGAKLALAGLALAAGGLCSCIVGWRAQIASSPRGGCLTEDAYTALSESLDKAYDAKEEGN